MDEMDDLLEAGLSGLEQGKRLDDVLAGLPELDAETLALLQLATAVRDIPHPVPERSPAFQALEGLARAAPALPRPSVPAPRRWSLQGWLPRLAVTLATVVGVLLLSGLLAWRYTSPPGSGLARLGNAHGDIQLMAPGKDGWQAAAADSALGAGERIRTGANAGAELVFYEGTRLTLGPETDLTLTRLSGAWGQGLQVSIQQRSGETHHDVVPLRGADSFYQVNTPTGTASVHGTQFDVLVSQDLTRVAVDTGRVGLQNNGDEVFIEAGQAVAVEPGEDIAAPDYRFSAQGTLTPVDQDQGTWAVAGVPFSAPPQAQPASGEAVRVEGRILSDGSRVADVILPAQGEPPAASFTGLVESGEDGQFKVGNTTVQLNSDTQWAATLNPGQPVRVWFTSQQDGRWLAQRIELLVELPLAATRTPSAVILPSETNTAVFTATLPS
ncbi:MAG: FecR domain-containing protein, partial [Chloroflexi bacterium]|nr:FecR domain-containing protein [Chloroflexota bacterium]